MWAAKWGGLLPASQYKYLLRTKRVCNQCYFEESTHRQQRAPMSRHSSFVLFFPSVLPSSLITLSLHPLPLLSFLIIFPRLRDFPARRLSCFSSHCSSFVLIYLLLARQSIVLSYSPSPATLSTLHPLYPSFPFSLPV